MFAQALTILALPVLTRLYSPEDFSLLAVYVAILGILTVVACLRFEIAIPLPEQDEEGAHLLVLALGSALAIGALLWMVVMLLPAQITDSLGAPALSFGVNHCVDVYSQNLERSDVNYKLS